MTTDLLRTPLLGSVRDVLSQAVEQQHLPGAVALVRWRGRTLLHEAFGYAALEPEARSMRTDTVFDLASLTKPLATTGVILALVDRGFVSLDDPVDRYLPELTALARAGVTLRRLLSHSSGLPGWRPTYTWGRSPANVLSGLAALDLAYPPGTRVEYSCLGFITLGLLAERTAGEPLDRLADRLLFTPLGLGSTGYRLPLDAERFATTERGNAFEQAMLARNNLQFDGWRTSFYPGQVNDGNAFYGLAGVSGNAGLFGTAEDVGILGEMWLGGGVYREVRVLSQPVVALATTNQTPGLNAPRGLGWQLTGATAPDAEELSIPASSRGYFPPELFEAHWEPRPSGELLSSRAFGHTGFTGTSVWIDPQMDLVVVLLTNRTHPRVDDTVIASLRARFHNAVAAAVTA